tara:strand:+ start:9299 stop:11107 length:1809 start_codon:yes stop_codon:yes gene_type:complete
MKKKIFEEFNPIDSFRVKKYFENNNSPYAKYIQTFGYNDKEIQERFSYIDSILPESVLIKGYPIGITEIGNIVCIPRERDAPSTGIFGLKRTGKTLLAHAMIDRFYNYQKEREDIVILNDYTGETVHWNYPMVESIFERKLPYLYEKSVALPIVYLSPKVQNYRKIRSMAHNAMNIELNLDFNDFTDNIQDYVDLGNSLKYFRNIDWSEVNTRDDMINTLTENLPKTDAMKSVRDKIFSVLNQHLNEGVISLEDDRITRLQDDEEEESIMAMLLKHKAVPSLITKDINHKDFFSGYIGMMMEDLLDYHRTRKKYDSRLHIFVDELSLMIKGKTENLITEIVKTGGPMNVGSIINEQNISDVNPSLSGNMTYSFGFRMKSGDDIKVFAKQNGLSDNEKKMLTTLPDFTFFGATTKKFFVYDTFANEFVDNETKIVAMLIPPLSHHAAPDDIISVVGRRSEGAYYRNYFAQMLKKKDINLTNPLTKKRIFSVPTTKNVYNPEVKLPILVKYVDVARGYYGKSLKNKVVSYDAIKNLSVYVYLRKGNPKQYFFESGLNPTENKIPLAKLEKDMHIIMNTEKRYIQLIGKNCYKKKYYWDEDRNER